MKAEDKQVSDMNGVEEAKQVFSNAGLAFPNIPEELAVRLEKKERWIFSTLKVEVYPYDLSHYISEFEESQVEDYAILSCSGHGVNSYAVQYYIVYGALGMFLHLGWGGVYMDNQLEATKIQGCFSLADEIVLLVKNEARFEKGDRLTVVASDFYGSYWTLLRGRRQKQEADSRIPAVVLNEVLHWLGTAQLRGNHPC
jgi:hypothetical protein